MRTCEVCGQSLSGRSDRRFCSRHSARVEVVVSSQTKERWQREAESQGLTLTDWIVGRVEYESLPTKDAATTPIVSSDDDEVPPHPSELVFVPGLGNVPDEPAPSSEPLVQKPWGQVREPREFDPHCD